MDSYVDKSSNIRIIHLSDFHYKKEFEKDFDKIMEIIREKTMERATVCEAKNVIILSGDIAYSGADEEYSDIKSRLERLRNGVNAIGIFSSPGNHDIDRKKYSTSLLLNMDDVIKHEDWNQIKELESEVHSNAKATGSDPYLDSYLKFSRELEKNNKVKVTYNGLTGVAKLVLGNKYCVNILLLNSAWLLSPSYTYFGYIGECQIESASKLVEPCENGNCFNISVFHHPFQALVPVSQDYFPDLMDLSNIILTGHVHRWQSFIGISSESEKYGRFPGKCIMVGARCTREEHSGGKYLPGFNIIELKLNFENKVFDSDIFKYVWINDETISVEDKHPFLTINSTNENLSLRSSKYFESHEIDLIKKARKSIKFFTNVVRNYDISHKKLIEALIDARKKNSDMEISYWTFFHDDEDYLGALVRLAIGCRIYYVPEEYFSELSRSLGGKGVRIVMSDETNLIRGHANDSKRGATFLLSYLENDPVGVRGYSEFWSEYLDPRREEYEEKGLKKIKEYFSEGSNSNQGRALLRVLVDRERIETHDNFLSQLFNGTT